MILKKGWSECFPPFLFWTALQFGMDLGHSCYFQNALKRQHFLIPGMYCVLLNPYQNMPGSSSELTPKPANSQPSSSRLMHEENIRNLKTTPNVSPALKATPIVIDTPWHHTSQSFTSLPGNLCSLLSRPEVRKHGSDPVLAANQRRQGK